jgi:hypothetical protein
MVRFPPALKPKAMLLLPRAVWSASNPMAVLLEPVELSPNAPAPLAVFLLPVVMPSAANPIAVLR